MPKPKTPRKRRSLGGRPKAPMDARVVRVMAERGCTNRDIAQAFHCDEDTVHNRFSELLDKSRAKRRERLRMKQTQLAMRGNTALLIFLGKNELHQTDRTDVTSGDKPVGLEALVLGSMPKGLLSPPGE